METVSFLQTLILLYSNIFLKNSTTTFVGAESTKTGQQIVKCYVILGYWNNRISWLIVESAAEGCSQQLNVKYVMAACEWMEPSDLQRVTVLPCKLQHGTCHAHVIVYSNRLKINASKENLFFTNLTPHRASPRHGRGGPLHIGVIKQCIVHCMIYRLCEISVMGQFCGFLWTWKI